MPAYLKREIGKRLTVHLGGFEKKTDFNDALSRVKSVPGRRPSYVDGKFECWEFPDDADTALRIMQMVEPVADAAVQALVQERSAQVSADLLTDLPNDARLTWDQGNHVLKPWQRAGVDFFMRNPRSILADEMGTGKTAQCYGTVLEAEARYDAGQGGPLREESRELPSLTVAPKAVLGHWAREIELGPRDRNGRPHYLDWPGRSVQVLDGKNEASRERQLLRPAQWYIVNWEKLRLMPSLAKKRWKFVGADEAHRAKNKEAQQTQALWKLTAPIQLAVTGTPVMNSPDELWALLRWLRPDEYAEHLPGGGFWPFHYAYVDEYKSKHGLVMTGVKNVDKLRFVLSDKLVRRTKRDVLKDLPEKLPPTVIPVELTPAQRRLYQEVEDGLLFDIAAMAEEIEDEQERRDWLTEIEGMSLARLQGLIPNGAARIAKLRQITSVAKAAVAEEIIRDNPGKPFVTFTWFVETARTLADSLSKGKPALRVGTIAGNDDPDPVKEAFQGGELDQVVATIAKGGVGLDLFRSDTAIFVDRDWVHKINEQAEDRLHRQGQVNTVNILILECPDTVDDGKIAPANRFKQKIVQAIFGDKA